VLDALGRDRGFEDGRSVVDAAKEGDAEAVDALRILGERLGIGIANVLHAYEPPWSASAAA
jgi:glucokinase